MANHALICGTNKSGTTSLFRYLGDHPKVTLCSRKEAGFFMHAHEGDSGQVYRDYCALFPSTYQGDSVLIEATPTYLDRGAPLARRIKDLLPNAKLVFVLREPTARLLSYFRSKHGLETAPVANVEFGEFARQALAEAGPEATQDPGFNSFGWQLIKAQYGRFLLEYLEVFDADDIHVTFFDHLVEDARAVTKGVCRFLDIDTSIYDTYEFSVENRSRVHRSSTLRTLASHTNAYAEPLLNRAPAIRRLLRNVYNAVNVEPRQTDEAADQEVLEQLTEYYVPHNRNTRDVLVNHLGIKRLPSWLTTA